MAQIELRLSSKKLTNGKSEILLRFYNGKKFNLRAKSGVYIDPKYFEYEIDWGKTVESGIKMPKKTISSTTKGNALKNGYVLRQNGDIVINEQRIISNSEREDIKAKQKTINDLKNFIFKCYESAEKTDLKDDWLKMVVDRFFHPENYMTPEEIERNKTFFELFDEFLKEKEFSDDRERGMQVLKRDIWRFTKFQQTMGKRKDFTFNVNEVTKDDIEDFRDYLKNEKALSERYPKQYAKMIKEQPNGIRRGRLDIEVRGNNTIITLMKKLRSFFSWCYDEGKTKNRPFDGVKIGVERYGTPYYLSSDERDKIAETDMPTEHLKIQRDIFVFHCFVGCRVSDLMKLTMGNITDGVLVYTPHKTKDEGDATQARVPLRTLAAELIKKYKGVDKQGRLFPFISQVKYNEAIKEIFTIAGIIRKVEVRNPKTGEMELCPINKIASSHIARRTFVANAYKYVSDPNIVGKMSGHVEGSKAFARYRNIDDDILKNVIDKM